MSFDTVFGHDIPKRILRAAIERDQVAHAYLFHGPGGIGKQTLGLRFAAAILTGAEQEEDSPLVRRILHEAHPDVVVFRGDEDSESVSVEKVRELEGEIIRRPFEGDRRVFLLDEVHRFTESAANALLKTLEEPPQGTVLILVADRLEGIPQTVLSRCQPVSFRPIGADHVQRMLIHEHGVEPSDAAWMAACSEGAPGRAMLLSKGGWGEIRDDLLGRFCAGPRSFGLEGAAYIAETCRKSASSAAEYRVRFRQVVHLCSLIARDLLVLASGGDETGLYNLDRVADLRRTAETVGTNGANAMLQSLFDALEWTDRNAHLDLMIENLSLSLGEAWTEPVEFR